MNRNLLMLIQSHLGKIQGILSQLNLTCRNLNLGTTNCFHHGLHLREVNCYKKFIFNQGNLCVYFIFLVNSQHSSFLVI